MSKKNKRQTFKEICEKLNTSENNRVNLMDSSKGHYNFEVNNVTATLFMNEHLKNSSGNLENAIKSAYKMLKDYDIKSLSFLPDLTESNSLPIGTSAVIETDKKINPSLIGMDIGCGYRLISFDIDPKRFIKNKNVKTKRVQNLVEKIGGNISNSKFKRQARSQFKSILPVKKTDLSAQKYLGTLGKGNHFVDFFISSEIYNTNACKNHNIKPNKIYFLIHSGSRELGFMTNSYFSELFQSSESSGFNDQYMRCLNNAKEYASLNRKMISKSIEDFFGQESNLILDEPHNDISRNGNKYTIRKGAQKLRKNGLAIIPGTCTSEAYLVQGSDGLNETNYSINHGCGRKYTRSQVFSKFRKKNFNYFFKDIALNVNYKKMIEEIPYGYKKIEEIINSVEDSGLAYRIAKLMPLGVIVEE